MAIFEITRDSLVPLAETRFDNERIYERSDLQRYLKQHIGMLAPDLMVICEEYSDWVDSNRRVDLLCIDTEANLVVVELKRDNDGGHMELQAIRYAAMLSAMTFKQLVDAHAAYIRAFNCTAEDAKAAILAFLQWDEPNEEMFAKDVKIILAASDFSKEITTAVLWLNERDLDIRCIRMKPYRTSDGRILVDVQQLIPLPEVAEFQTKIRAKEQAERENRIERHDIRFQFWAALLDHAKTRTSLFANKKPTSAGGFGVSPGRAGLLLGFITRGNDSHVELEIALKDIEKCHRMFAQLKSHAPEIERAFEDKLVWDHVPDRRACHILSTVPGGWKSPREEWPAIHRQLIDKIIRLDDAVRPYVAALPI
ncbi:DUF4268 domain-containing protein [Massilia sp.]|uniref:DUF4268 domain-containing protein n=1 Tax=Massilia sp. TaxID=1882437 RepID=UPI00391D06E5